LNPPPAPPPLGLWLALDVEATCWEPGTPERAQQSRRAELLEVGAAALAPFGPAPLALFSTDVRPTREPALTPFCVRLTGITQERADAAPPLPEALGALWGWCAPLRARCPRPDDPLALITWGGTDGALLTREARAHGVALPPWRPLDAQRAFERWRRRRGEGGAGFSLARALDALGEAREGRAHEALSDALAAWRVLARCLDPAALTPGAADLLAALAARAAAAPEAPCTAWRRDLQGALGAKEEFERHARELVEVGLVELDPRGRGARLTARGRGWAAGGCPSGEHPQLVRGEAGVAHEGGAAPHAALHLPQHPGGDAEGDAPAAHLAAREGEAARAE